MVGFFFFYFQERHRGVNVLYSYCRGNLHNVQICVAGRVVLGGVVESAIQLAHYACTQVDGEIEAPRKVLHCSVLTLKCVAVQRRYTTLALLP